MEFRFVTSRFKRIIGIFMIILGIILRLVTPFYIETYLFIPFLILAILLILNDTTQNSRIFAAIGMLAGLVIIYFSAGGIIDPYSHVAGLYFDGLLGSVPQISDVSTCVIGNVIMVVYAVVNMICCGLFLIPTSMDVDY